MSAEHERWTARLVPKSVDAVDGTTSLIAYQVALAVSSGTNAALKAPRTNAPVSLLVPDPPTPDTPWRPATFVTLVAAGAGGWSPRVVGFTGTRDTPSRGQAARLGGLLVAFRAAGAEWFEHGDCVGADEMAAGIATGEDYQVVSRPATGTGLRAFTAGSTSFPPMPPLRRNDAIVAVADVLLAVPATDTEVTRSGTWYTVRRARKAGLPIIVVAPSRTWLEPGR